VSPPGVVYVVAKAPRGGVAKTRLCPPLLPDQAARLAEAFLLDTVDTVRRAGLPPRVICRDRAERAYLAPVAGVHVEAQDGAGLGDALECAFRRGLDDGFPVVAVLGADSPTLPAAMLEQAFRAVAAGADVALGPSEDGGYYLLVARALHPSLFRNMPWSTSAVAKLTLRRCRAAGLRVHVLPLWYDVDDPAALVRLRRDLASATPHAVHTRAALAQAVVAAPPPGAALAAAGGSV
jgi:rSAM/selenodomain-associated transferase 1